MTNRNADTSQVEGGNVVPPPTGAPPPGAIDNRGSRNGNKVYKSGPLFLSSRGIGWTSWKKRWFILTRTSLVFFRNDPSAIPQKGSEVNLTLGGIDLNSSLSVVVKADKKLLTVLFPDSRDGNGRAFTLKAETTEDLHEWKAALEEALANAPSAALVMGQNGIFKSDQNEAADGSLEQSTDRQPAKSFVIGRPVLLALEDIDGTPSFLEKALRFLEEHGVKVEGILRQAADVDDVEHRIREYEQGKTDFSAEEDAHVIADCIKYVLRELPSSPVPASCCNALLEACRTDRSMRVSAMRTAICDTFPEPNRRLLQRILVMMQAVAANKAENRMSISAVAACMAPLLLRPLLAGDCELEHTFDMGGDGSVQLLQAAAAANHAQAIVITLLEEYENLFGEGNISTELYTDTEESGSESEELSDDGTYEDDEDGEDVSEGSDADMDEEIEGSSSCTCSEAGDSADQNQHDNKGSESLSSHSSSHEIDDDLDLVANESISCSRQRSRQRSTDIEVIDDLPDQSNNSSTVRENEPAERVEDDNPEIISRALPTESIQRSITVANGPVQNSKRPTVWGRTGAKKNLSMENIDVPIDDEAEIEKLEDMKIELQNKITAEKKENAVLQEDLENRKNALHKRRLALEQDVAKLQEQLQNEKDLRAALEAGLKMPQGPASISASINEKTKADLEEIAQAEADIISLKQKTEYLEMQVTQQREQNSVYALDSSNQSQQTSNQGRVKEKEKDFDASISSRNAEKSMRTKDTQVSKAQTEKDAKNQPPSLLSKPSAQNQQSDSLRNPKSAVTQAALALMEQGGIDKSLTANSRRSAPRGEVGPTSSALTKLTNRLNFLKERRNQIANELQTMNKEGKNSSQAAPKQERGSAQSESLPSNVIMDKSKESEGQSSEKGRAGSESNQYQQSIDRGGVTEGSSFQNSDTNRKVDIRSRPEGQGQGQSTPNLDREKSESFPNNEKSRSIVPPRTFSR